MARTPFSVRNSLGSARPKNVRLKSRINTEGGRTGFSHNLMHPFNNSNLPHSYTWPCSNSEPQGFYNDHQLSHNLGILYPNPVAPPLQAMPLPVHISSGYVTVPTNSSYSTASTMNWRAQFDTFYPNDPERKRQLLEVLSSKWYAYEGGSREPLHALRPFIDEKSTNEFECSVCLKVLPRLDRAEDHFRTHIRHRPFQCIGKCGKLNCNIRFYTKGALEAHERIGEKRTVCGTCGKTVDSKNLKRHQQSKQCQAKTTNDGLY